MTLGRLATHVASMPGWRRDSRVAGRSTSPTFRRRRPRTRPPTRCARASRPRVAARGAALCASTDARLVETWTLRKDGQVLLTLPRIVALRTEGLYHLTHHRGQLTVYLRLLDIAVPPIYGPTADEGRL